MQAAAPATDGPGRSVRAESGSLIPTAPVTHLAEFGGEQAINHDLALTATRLDGADKLLSKSPATSLRHPTALATTTAGIDKAGEDGLANTWPTARPSSIRVDGQRALLSRTTPSHQKKVARPSAARLPRDKEPGARRMGSLENFLQRARTAMESQGMHSDTLREFLLPSSAADPSQETSTNMVRSWEVFKVLTLDLGLQLSEVDKQLISARFGDGEDGGKVDADALLAAIALDHPETGGNAVSPAATSPSTTVPPKTGGTSTLEHNHDADHSHKRRLHRNEGVPAAASEVTTRSWAGGRADEDESRVDAGVPTRRDQSLHDSELSSGQVLGGPEGGDPTDQAPPAYEDLVMQSPRIEGKGPAGAVATIEEIALRAERKYSGDSLNDWDDSRTRGRSGNAAGSNDGTRDEAAAGAAAAREAAALQEENAKLRSELEVFDLGFFEEVEDLKYSYASLRREADKLARKQGIPSLSKSLDLPEEGEEPWDRSVDMAHHTVDWAETAKNQRTAAGRGGSSPSSPPRGTHAARLARRWDLLSSGVAADVEEVGFPVGSPTRGHGGTIPGRVSAAPGGGRYRGGGIGGKGEAFAVTPHPQRGLIAAHERKLAWEISCGGMGSLARLRENTGRVGPATAVAAGDGFWSDEQVFLALRNSGYALELEDVAVLRTGLGSDAKGRVDVEEFVGMCEDVASVEEWYLPPRSAVVAIVAGRANARSPAKRSGGGGGGAFSSGSLPFGMLLRELGDEVLGERRAGGGDGFGAPEQNARGGGLPSSTNGVISFPVSAGQVPHETLYLGGTVYGERTFLEPSKTVESVLAELKDQLSLLDIDHLIPARDHGARGTGSGEGAVTTLGKAVGARFSRRDPTQSGLLSAREVGLALEDVGVRLQADEVITLAKSFKPPVGGPQENRGNGSDLSRGREGYASDAATAIDLDGGGLDGVVAEYAPLVRLVVDSLAEASGVDPAVGGRVRLGQKKAKWNERMPAPAKRLRSALTAGKGRGGLERLRQRFRDFDIDGDGCLGRREFMRALNLALACETGDDSDPSPYFTVGGVLSEQEAAELMDRLDRDRDGRVSWEGFVKYFADAVHGEEGGGRGGGHPESWFQLEVDIAEKLLQQMEAQGGSTARRAWVNSLRRRFQTADIHETGTLNRDEFFRCLRSMHVSLSAREGERLFLSLLPTTTDPMRGARYPELVNFLRGKNAMWYDVESDIADKILTAMGPDGPSRRAWLNRIRRRFMSLDAFRAGVLGASDLLQALKDGGCYLGLEEEARLLDALETEESARFDTEGGVSYRELLLFCARHAGKWSEGQPLLAERLREALRSQAKTTADVRRLFRRLDDDGDGFIDRKDFKIGLHSLGLGFVTRDEQEVLMDALDAEGSGRVRYADFASFFMDSDPWFKTDADLAERLCKSFEMSGDSGGDGDGGGGGPGSVLGRFRERFVAVDRDKTGFINRAQFRAVLASLPGTQDLTEDEVDRLSTLLDDQGDGRVSYRSLLDLLVRHLGDWHKRIPKVASELSLALQNTQYGLKACVENFSRRLNIADHKSTGRLPPSTFARCLRSVGLSLAPESLGEMVSVLDAYGDELIPITPVLEFLRREAGISPEGGDVQQQAGGEVGVAFREAVRSLAEAEQQYANSEDESDGGGTGGYGHSDRDAATPRGAITFNRRAEPAASTRSYDGTTANWALRDTARLRREKRGRTSGGIREERGAWAIIPWSVCLRRVFDRWLDVDGDGFLTEGDLAACLPEIGVYVTGRDAARTLLSAMDSRQRGLGQATFKDFVEFMGTNGSSRRRGGRSPPGTAPYSPVDKRRTSLGPGQTRLLRHVRLALGLPAAAASHEDHEDDSRETITSKDLRRAMARLDPHGSGRLPLGKIKAALQGFGLRVGNVPHASWLDLTGSLDQDAYGHLFYSDFVDLLMPSEQSPYLSSPDPPSDRRKSNAHSRKQPMIPAEALAERGTRSGNLGRSVYGAFEGGESNDRPARKGVGDDWRSRTYPPAAVSSVAPASGKRPARPSQYSRPSLRSTGSSTALPKLLERLLDGVFDENGGVAEGGVALRSAFRRQDLTRSGRLSQGEFRLALENAGAPISSMEVATVFEFFDKRGSGMIDHDRFANFILRRSGTEAAVTATTPSRNTAYRAPSSSLSPSRSNLTIGPRVASVDGPAASTIRALKNREPEVASLRRQLQQRVAKRQRAVIGGLELKKLLRSCGLDLSPAEISHLRQKCGDPAGQVNTLALLAYLGPAESEAARAYGENDGLPPDSLLRGWAHESTFPLVGGGRWPSFTKTRARGHGYPYISRLEVRGQPHCSSFR
ncbi:hypothetical protein Esi_0083_0058 [Ectocarpus siliculosus]|uniref:EF-hand domain-containing protein n=1 Tax=Ectocarpus siliculosus TaxID=2880 RepID=D7G7I0_ECTSI|nr:hypothetical protein Esi_0083_0058 [Ectocarpus siliculosus]|eukprot:CBJ27722.1 hypothetical protein Esi_0083_0058 [Ectocarpus siliculosus]